MGTARTARPVGIVDNDRADEFAREKSETLKNSSLPAVPRRLTLSGHLSNDALTWHWRGPAIGCDNITRGKHSGETSQAGPSSISARSRGVASFQLRPVLPKDGGQGPLRNRSAVLTRPPLRSSRDADRPALPWVIACRRSRRPAQKPSGSAAGASTRRPARRAPAPWPR